MCRIVLFDPKLTPTPMSILAILRQRKIFHFQHFLDISMTKEQQQPPWLINFAKTYSERVLQIQNTSYKVRASLIEWFLNGSSEFGYPGPLTHLPQPDKVKKSPRTHKDFIHYQITKLLRYVCTAYLTEFL